MKTKFSIFFLFISLLYQSCKTQQLKTKTSLPKIANQIKGELDYTNGGFELVQWQKNGDEITLGTIDKEGNIHLNLPEYDIQALSDKNNKASIQSQFNMIDCKGKGKYDLMGQPLFETPYDEVHLQLYAPMSVKKYDAYLAYINPVSDEKMLAKNSFDKIVGNKYYWVYVDRNLHYEDTCMRVYDKDVGLETEMIADIQFKKGWNFIKKNIVEVQNYGENEEKTVPKKILYNLSSYTSQDIKWHLARRLDDEKIKAAKKNKATTSQ